MACWARVFTEDPSLPVSPRRGRWGDSAETLVRVTAGPRVPLTMANRLPHGESRGLCLPLGGGGFSGQQTLHCNLGAPVCWAPAIPPRDSLGRPVLIASSEWTRQNQELAACSESRQGGKGSKGSKPGGSGRTGQLPPPGRAGVLGGASYCIPSTRAHTAHLTQRQLGARSQQAAHLRSRLAGGRAGRLPSPPPDTWACILPRGTPAASARCSPVQAAAPRAGGLVLQDCKAPPSRQLPPTLPGAPPCICTCGSH